MLKNVSARVKNAAKAAVSERSWGSKMSKAKRTSVPGHLSSSGDHPPPSRSTAEKKQETKFDHDMIVEPIEGTEGGGGGGGPVEEGRRNSKDGGELRALPMDE